MLRIINANELNDRVDIFPKSFCETIVDKLDDHGIALVDKEAIKELINMEDDLK